MLRFSKVSKGNIEKIDGCIRVKCGGLGLID